MIAIRVEVSQDLSNSPKIGFEEGQALYRFLGTPDASRTPVDVACCHVTNIFTYGARHAKKKTFTLHVQCVIVVMCCTWSPRGCLTCPVLYRSRFIVQNKPEYCRLLQAVRKADAWEEWVLYMYAQLCKYMLAFASQRMPDHQRCPEIDFIDDRDGCLFTATVNRKPESELALVEGSSSGSEKSSEKSIGLMRAQPNISATRIAQEIGITSRAVEKQITALKKAGRVCRIGPAKGGHWEVDQ